MRSANINNINTNMSLYFNTMSRLGQFNFIFLQFLKKIIQTNVICTLHTVLAHVYKNVNHFIQITRDQTVQLFLFQPMTNVTNDVNDIYL